MNILAQTIANGMIAGAIILLVASGFTLIYLANRFVNFAHGAVVALGAFVFYALIVRVQMPLAVALLGAVVISAIFGLALYETVYAPLQKRRASGTILLISSLALTVVIENLILIVFGSGAKTVPLSWLGEPLEIAGAVITRAHILVIAVALSVTLLLGLFLRLAPLGIRMRAVADNPELAAINGIQIINVRRSSFMIGSLLAGLAGALIALQESIDPGLGTALSVKGFAAMVVGGIGAPLGVPLGSFFLGIIENIVGVLLSSGYKEAAAFGVLVIFLVFRPQGILGKMKGTRL